MCFVSHSPGSFPPTVHLVLIACLQGQGVATQVVDYLFEFQQQRVPGSAIMLQGIVSKPPKLRNARATWWLKDGLGFRDLGTHGKFHDQLKNFAFARGMWHGPEVCACVAVRREPESVRERIDSS